MEDKRKRMEELVAHLNRAGRAYYQESRELISNQEYDKLYDELQRLETETGIVLANSPTVHVGYEVISSLPKEQIIEVHGVVFFQRFFIAKIHFVDALFLIVIPVFQLVFCRRDFLFLTLAYCPQEVCRFEFLRIQHRRRIRYERIQ